MQQRTELNVLFIKMKTMKVKQKIITVTTILLMACTAGSFAQSKKQDAPSSDMQELRLEFNVMKNISLVKSAKYDNNLDYRFIEEGIYEEKNLF